MSQSITEYLAANKAATKNLYAEIPEVLKSFGALGRSAHEGTVLDKKTTELIASAIGVAIRCDGCIGYHAANFIKHGGTRKEFAEMLAVVVQMQGGPGVVYAADALAAYDELAKPAS